MNSQTDVKKITEYQVRDTNHQVIGTSESLETVVVLANNRALDDRWSLIKVRTTTVTTTTTTVTGDWVTL